MKKIKHIKDIEYEKMQLRIKQLELERKISNNWEELKKSLNPKIFLRDKPFGKLHDRSEKSTFFSDALGYGAGYLSGKLSEIAGQKIESAMQKGVDLLAQKLNNVFQKKH